MIKYPLNVSIDERNILDAASFIGFGELLDVEITDAGPYANFEVTASQIRFLKLIRDGISKIDRIIVHNAEPVSLEINGELRGIKYIRKFKV